MGISIEGCMEGCCASSAVIQLQRPSPTLKQKELVFACALWSFCAGIAPRLRTCLRPSAAATVVHTQHLRVRDRCLSHVDRMSSLRLPSTALLNTPTKICSCTCKQEGRKMSTVRRRKSDHQGAVR